MKIQLIFLLALVYFLLLSVLPVEAQAPSKKNSPDNEKTSQSLSDKNRKTLLESANKKPWSNIKGFRSAKFGMDQKSVYRAIAKDFKLAKSKVKKETHPKEKTTSFTIFIPELFPIGVAAKVIYIFGYKTKKLIHINISWGAGAVEKIEDIDMRGVIATTNLLQIHFLKKKYKEKSLVINGQVSRNSTIVFRGKDKKGRMVLLLLYTKLKEEGQTNEQASGNITLVLNYILNSEDPDVRKVIVKDDEL